MNPNHQNKQAMLSGGEQSKEKYFLQNLHYARCTSTKRDLKIGFQVEVQLRIPTDIAIDSGA